eukprot:GHVT01009978.1.p1 GENE.GHVT01009978.1~~GHVT01009978.1.p1  ORF type:complete len:335 (-),score=96.57 GHVT01009978.1:318-1322(-)
MAAACQASELQIWTDVDGVLTADPNMVPDAATISVLTFEEAAELSYFGAKVLHPQTMLPAMHFEIPLVVKNSFNPGHPGTQVVMHCSPTAEGLFSTCTTPHLRASLSEASGSPSAAISPSSSSSSSSSCLSSSFSSSSSPCATSSPSAPPPRTALAPRVLVRAVTCKRGVTIVEIQSTRMLGAHGFLAYLFRLFEQFNISIDVIATSEVSVSVSLDAAQDEDQFVHLETQLRGIGTVTIHRDMCILSIIGDKGRATEILAMAFLTLKDLGVALEMVSVGASKVNLTLVISDAKAREGVVALHATFFHGECTPRVRLLSNLEGEREEAGREDGGD